MKKIILFLFLLAVSMCSACGKEEQQKNTGFYDKPEIIVLQKIIFPGYRRSISNRCIGSFITAEGKVYEYHFDFGDMSGYQLTLDAYSYEYIYAYIEEHYKTKEEEFRYVGQLDEGKLEELWTAICQLPDDTKKYEILATGNDAVIPDYIWTVYRENHIRQMEEILLKVVGDYEITNHNLGAEELWENCRLYIPEDGPEIDGSSGRDWLWPKNES